MAGWFNIWWWGKSSWGPGIANCSLQLLLKSNGILCEQHYAQSHSHCNSLFLPLLHGQCEEYRVKHQCTLKKNPCISVFQGLIWFILLLEVSVFPAVVLCHQFQRHCLTENLCNRQSLGQMFIFPPYQPPGRMYMCLGEGLLSSESSTGSRHPAVLPLGQAMGERFSSLLLGITAASGAAAGLCFLPC